MAVAGPIERAITLETGSADRRANMDAFTKRALELLYEAISAKA
jgi:nicotinamide-nucleotide amidase